MLVLLLLIGVVLPVFLAAQLPVMLLLAEPGRRSAAKLMTKDETRKIASGVAKLPDLLGATQKLEPD